MAHLPRDGTGRAKDGTPADRAVRDGSLDVAESEPGHQLRPPLSTNNITAFRALRRVAFLRGLYATSGVGRPGWNGALTQGSFGFTHASRGGGITSRRTSRERPRRLAASPVCTENLMRIDCVTESPEPQRR